MQDWFEHARESVVLWGFDALDTLEVHSSPLVHACHISSPMITGARPGHRSLSLTVSVSGHTPLRSLYAVWDAVWGPLAWTACVRSETVVDLCMIIHKRHPQLGDGGVDHRCTHERAQVSGG